jgi:lipopolysaccharide transport protein LptA
LNKGEVTGYAERLEGDVALESIVLEGKPKVVVTPSKTSPLTIEADIFEIASIENTISARGNPRIFWEEAVVTADRLTYLQAEQLLQLTDNVKVAYKDIRAGGSSADYLTEESRIVLEGDARATQGENKLRGKKIVVSLKDEKIYVMGKGKVIITEEELK